jgi:hypothetical protein
MVPRGSRPGARAPRARFRRWFVVVVARGWIFSPRPAEHQNGQDGQIPLAFAQSSLCLLETNQATSCCFLPANSEIFLVKATTIHRRRGKVKGHIPQWTAAPPTHGAGRCFKNPGKTNSKTRPEQTLRLALTPSPMGLGRRSHHSQSPFPIDKKKIPPSSLVNHTSLPPSPQPALSQPRKMTSRG